MLIAIIGENCAGKSTLAKEIAAKNSAGIITGKDYLRMAKSPDEAARLFKQKLSDSVSGENLIYVISEKEHLAFLPEGAVNVLVTAELDTIKERFRARMRGNLPAPVETMLEKKHGMFDEGEYRLRFHSGRDDVQSAVDALVGSAE